MRVDSGGVSLEVTVTGSGPAVLATHGFGASSAMYEPNLPALAARHRVITWDLRGHGGSDAPDDPACYDLPLSLGDMAAVLDAADVADAVLMGHSLGGYLSLAFALEHPEWVRGLVLIGTGPGYRSERARARWNEMAESLAVRSTEPGLQHAARGILPQRDARVIDQLASIEVPCLVVVGERDEQFHAGSEYLTRRIPNARSWIVPDAGHMPNMSHPEAFEAEVGAFLDTLDELDTLDTLET